MFRQSKFFMPCNYYRPKRSFGQGNIFTTVCDSVHRGGVPYQSTPPPPTSQVHPHPPEHTPLPQMSQVHPPGANITPGYGQRSAGTHPTGIHSCHT